jgi:propionyl-CoA carboxylase alpha chain
VLLTLEAMKMEHVIRAPAAGTVREVRVTIGDQVDTGDVLVVIDTEDARDTDEASDAGDAA